MKHCETCICSAVEPDALPEALRDPAKNLERGRQLLEAWGPTPVTDAALAESKESPLARAIRIARGDTGPPTEPVRFAEKGTRPLPDHLKAPVKAGDPCPAIDDAHTEHQGKCVYCGAPMAQVKAECALCAEGMNSFADPATGNRMHARNGVVTVCTAQNGT